MRKVFLYPLLTLFAIALLLGVKYYRYIFTPNVDLKGTAHYYLHIPTGGGFKTVCDSLYSKGIILNRLSFEWTARRKGYPEKVRPGRYRINDGMSNNELVGMLRSGAQEPVKLRFQSARTPAELAGKIARQIEADSLSLINLFRNTPELKEYRVIPGTLFTIMVPNTYEFYWNTSAHQFLSRMSREAEKFWVGFRDEKARNIGLSRHQVVILASIVEKETSKDDERSAIAGVYMNRLSKGWPLQADPTLIYAWNDYTIKRVLNKHKKIDSPYNTYLHTGLPPGPICLPSIASIDAVLNYSHHKFMYFCAREDFSGYHNFSKTISEHNIHAARYQNALIRLLKEQKK